MHLEVLAIWQGTGQMLYCSDTVHAAGLEKRRTFNDDALSLRILLNLLLFFNKLMLKCTVGPYSYTKSLISREDGISMQCFLQPNANLGVYVTMNCELKYIYCEAILYQSDTANINHKNYLPTSCLLASGKTFLLIIILYLSCLSDTLYSSSYNL